MNIDKALNNGNSKMERFFQKLKKQGKTLGIGMTRATILAMSGPLSNLNRSSERGNQIQLENSSQEVREAFHLKSFEPGIETRESFHLKNSEPEPLIKKSYKLDNNNNNLTTKDLEKYSLNDKKTIDILASEINDLNKLKESLLKNEVMLSSELNVKAFMPQIDYKIGQYKIALMIYDIDPKITLEEYKILKDSGELDFFKKSLSKEGTITKYEKSFDKLDKEYMKNMKDERNEELDMS